MRDAAALLESLHTRLAAVRHRESQATLLRSSLLALASFLGVVFASLVVEQVFFLRPLGRSLLVYGTMAIVLAQWCVTAGSAALRLVGMAREEADDTTARRVGNAFPAIHDRLLNALQLAREELNPGVSASFSPALLEAALQELEETLRPVDFSSMVSFTGSRKAGKWAMLAAGLLLLLFVAAPATFLSTAYRLAHPGEAFAAPAPFQLHVDPGDCEVVKGQAMTITVRAVGAAPERVALTTLPEGQTTAEDHEVAASPDGAFRFTLPSLKTSLQYRASSGDVVSAAYRVTVVDRPAIRLLRATVTPPGYTGLPPLQLPDNIGDVTALKGSRLALLLQASKPLGAAVVQFNDGSSTPMTLMGHAASVTFPLLKDATYHVALRDTEGTPAIDPVEYTAKIIADAAPSISILSPGENRDVTDNASLPLTIKITDDFGFSRLRLAFKLVHSRYEPPAQEFSFLPIPLPAGRSTEALVPYLWPLTPLHLAPEDVVSYYAEVFDNDIVSGPKSAVSEIFSIRLPSLEEVIAGVDKEHDQSLSTMQEALTTAEQARKDVEELVREAKKNGEKLDWQDQKKAEQVVKKYEAMQKQLQEARRALDDATQRMEEHRLLSPETLAKYQELQHLMQEFDSPELKEALRALQQSMQTMSPEAMRQAMEQLALSEETFRKSIERTMQLLKRIQIEQKLDRSLRQAEALQREEAALQRQTDSAAVAKRPPTSDLAARQRELQERARRMESDLRDLQHAMEEFPKEMPLGELSQLNKEVADSSAADAMRESTERLEAGEMSQAGERQQRATRRLQSMQRQLASAQSALQSKQQQQIVNELRRGVQEMLALSKRQEDLKNQTRNMEENSPQFKADAEQQMELMGDLRKLMQRMATLSEKSFAVTPEMGKAMGDALRSMGEAMKGMESRTPSASAANQEGSMAALNQSAQLLQGAMESMMQGGGQGMGMSGFMQRLRQLSAQQLGINNGTRQAGGMSMEQAAAAARLAGEQGIVRKSLEQLQREAASSGDLKRMLGDLSSIVQAMKEVQSELAQGSVNPETMHKQDRILSRLLDAQRSTRERDYEQRRQSASGQNLSRQSPPPLQTEEMRTRLRRDLLRALEQGYTREYQELIKKYFEALESSTP